MPLASYNYGSPLTIADFQQGGTPAIPTFSQFAGTSLPNLLESLGNTKIRVQAPLLAEQGRQADLANQLQHTIAGQNYNLGQGQLYNALTLGQGQLSNQMGLANLQDALERARLGESGREFDVTSGLTSNQQKFEQDVINRQLQRQAEQYQYLLSLMGNPTTSAAALKALTGYDTPAAGVRQLTPLNTAEGSLMVKNALQSPEYNSPSYSYQMHWPT